MDEHYYYNEKYQSCYVFIEHILRITTFTSDGNTSVNVIIHIKVVYATKLYEPINQQINPHKGQEMFNRNFVNCDRLTNVK